MLVLVSNMILQMMCHLLGEIQERWDGRRWEEAVMGTWVDTGQGAAERATGAEAAQGGC